MISHNQSAFAFDNSQPIATIVSGKHISATEAEAVAGTFLTRIEVPSANKPVLIRVSFSSNGAALPIADEFTVTTLPLEAGTTLDEIILAVASPAGAVLSMLIELTESTDLYFNYVPAVGGTRIFKVLVEVVSERIA